MAKLYFSHDVDARNSAELLKVRMRLGPEGYAIYFMLLEKLAEVGDHRLECDYQCLSFDLRSEEQKIKSIVEDFGLFVSDGKTFYSKGLDKRLNVAKDISEKRRRAGIAGAIGRWQTDGKQMANADVADSKHMVIANEGDGTKNKIKNKNNIINNKPPQQQHACAHEGGSAEEDERNGFYDIFYQFDVAMSVKIPMGMVISATDDNRLRRFLTEPDEMRRNVILDLMKTYLVDKKDIVGLRTSLENMERQGSINCILFELWKILTSLATLSKSDQKKIRHMVRSTDNGIETLSDAMKEIEASNGKIKMPSRYIISKFTQS